MPDFQREEVWPDDKKRLLIDSILKGWHLPKFYFRKLDNNMFECVDGQQRLVAIFEYFGEQIALSTDANREYPGLMYSELPDDASDAFDDYEIDIEEIEDANETELEELFLRLQLGTPLNTAEKLNAISGNMRDFCHEIADDSLFSERIALNDTRYAHFEIAVKWALIEARGIQPQMLFPQLESFLRDNRTFSTQSATAKRIKKTLAFLNRAFPEKCKHIRSKSNTLSICMLASRIVEQNLDSDEATGEFRTFVNRFFTNLSVEVEKGVEGLDRELLRYQQAITSGSTGEPSVKMRFNILTKRLATSSSMFSNLLGAYSGAADEAIINISEHATKSGELIYQINEKYAASKGQDLFKMTNKSRRAISGIANPCRDIQQFGEFVDLLYFLIYEGSGSCDRLPDPVPEFAMDVKLLRNLCRHDLDHGSAREVARKRTQYGEIFHKYSGKRTPDECGPEDFMATQMSIMEALLLFLSSLS